MRNFSATGPAFALLLIPAASSAATADFLLFQGLDGISLPDGFEISVYNEGVTEPRSMCLGDQGTVFVGTRETGAVYALRDEDGMPGAERTLVIAEGLYMPNGVAFREGDLYVSEVDRVLRFDDIEDRLEDPPTPVVVSDGFPDERAHGWKYIAFGPDDLLYVPVGAPCNVCDPEDRRFATIMRMEPDGSNLEVYVRGVRNTVGFDWDPDTGRLWFTDNGRDRMGDDVPPDELNRVETGGEHFGFPYVHGIDLPDPQFGGEEEVTVPLTPPVAELGPHVAALGMVFYTGESFPEEYWGQVLIAEHGSWNRSEPIGYRVTMVRLRDGDPVSYEVFAEGWLTEEGAFGRPVDLLVLRDGSLLVSDDRADRIYRITYSGGS